MVRNAFGRRRDLPFEIRAGETTWLAVKLVAGYPRRIEVASPFDDGIARSVQIE